MKNKTKIILSDISFILFLTLVLIGTFFSYFDTEHFITNIVLMYGCFIIVAITYFTNLTVGLVLDIIGVIATFSFMFYKALTEGYGIPANTYFWCFMYPAATVTISIFSKQHIELQKLSTNLCEQLKELILIDSTTGLKTKTALLNDAQIYMDLSKQYKHGLSLCMVSFRHLNEFDHLFPGERREDLVRHISALLIKILKEEDRVYIVDNEKMIWGILLHTTEQTTISVVLERLKQTLATLNAEPAFAFKQVSIDLQIGAIIYDNSIQNSNDLLNKATTKLMNDVK